MKNLHGLARGFLLAPTHFRTFLTFSTSQAGLRCFHCAVAATRVEHFRQGPTTSDKPPTSDAPDLQEILSLSIRSFHPHNPRRVQNFENPPKSSTLFIRKFFGMKSRVSKRSSELQNPVGRCQRDHRKRGCALTVISVNATVPLYRNTSYKIFTSVLLQAVYFVQVLAAYLHCVSLLNAANLPF